MILPLALGDQAKGRADGPACAERVREWDASLVEIYPVSVSTTVLYRGLAVFFPGTEWKFFS